MGDGTPNTPSAPGGDVPQRERPPAEMVAAAERDYRRTLGRHQQMIAAVRSLLAHGWTDIEAMAYVASSFRAQEDRSATWFLAAVSVVERAKQPDPPAGGSSGTADTEPPTAVPQTGWRHRFGSLTAHLRRRVPRTPDTPD